MLAKTESVAQLDALAGAVGPVPLLPLVESAEGLATLDLIACAPGVVRLVFGHLDFQVDLGMQCEDDERELDPVRLVFVTTSRRAGLAGPVDGVTINLKDANQVRLDTQRSRRFGFTGKLCTPPGSGFSGNQHSRFIQLLRLLHVLHEQMKLPLQLIHGRCRHLHSRP